MYVKRISEIDLEAEGMKARSKGIRVSNLISIFSRSELQTYVIQNIVSLSYYSVFHRFSIAKFAYNLFPDLNP
jgi:hypothetical protein